MLGYRNTKAVPGHRTPKEALCFICENLRLINPDLICKDPPVTAVSRMPRWNFSVVHRPYTNVTCGLRFDCSREVFDYYSARRRITTVRNFVRQSQNGLEYFAIKRDLKLNSTRHPDPRADVLQKSRTELFDVFHLLKIDHSKQILAPVALPRATTPICRAPDSINEREVASGWVLLAVLRT